MKAAGLKDVFDAKYYADQYPDLKAAFGYDEEALFQHFVNNGLKEGRNMSPILNVQAYRESYQDLDEAFGDNWDAYVEHYFIFGVNEKRKEGVLFDPLEYADSYGDIKAAFGNDINAIVRHYLDHGIEENRTEGTAGFYKDIAVKQETEERIAQEEKQAAETSQKWSRKALINKLQEIMNKAESTKDWDKYWAAYGYYFKYGIAYGLFYPEDIDIDTDIEKLAMESYKVTCKDTLSLENASGFLISGVGGLDTYYADYLAAVYSGDEKQIAECKTAYNDKVDMVTALFTAVYGSEAEQQIKSYSLKALMSGSGAILYSSFKADMINNSNVKAKLDALPEEGFPKIND